MFSKTQRSRLLQARRSVKFGRSLVEDVKKEVEEYSLPLDEAIRSFDRTMDWLNELTDETPQDKGCAECGRPLKKADEQLGVCGKC